MFFLACRLHRLRRPILPVLQERTATEATSTSGASCVTWDRVAALSSYQISHLRRISAIREYRILKHRIGNCKVSGKYSFEHAARVRGGRQVAPIIEIGLTQPRPVRHNPTTIDRATKQDGRRRSAMVGTARDANSKHAIRLHEGTDEAQPNIVAEQADRSRNMIIFRPRGQ